MLLVDVREPNETSVESYPDSVLVPLEANGSPAFAQYRPREGGGREPWALHVLQVENGRIAHISSFLDLDTGLFRLLGLPAALD